MDFNIPASLLVKKWYVQGATVEKQQWKYRYYISIEVIWKDY
jgi:hypothetical protein